jgi:hypothetical protein
LFKIVFFCLGLLLAAAPLAARADSAPPTPAPPEHFVTVDGAVTGTTYNELAPGTSTGGWGVHAVAEIPVIGHNWAAQLDYRGYSYQHKALGTMANGITFACAAGDPGCVTPIGFQTYNRAFTPGPVNYLNAFNAQDSTTQISFGTKIAPIERYYVSVGYVFRGTNAPGYPGEGGMGFGIDKLPDVDRAFSLYGNFWVFFNVGGNVTGPSTAALGGFSGYPFTVSYRLFTYRLGATFNIPKTPLFLDLSDVGDRADVTSAAPSDAQHNALFLGAGIKF